MKTKMAEEIFTIPANTPTTLIDKGMVFTGTFENEGDGVIHIKGEVRGTIKSKGPVVIERGAVFGGDLEAQKVRLAGKIIRGGSDGAIGRVAVEELLLVEDTGFLQTDDLSYGGLFVEFGGLILGKMSPTETAVAEAQKRAETPVDEPKSAIPQAAQQAMAAAATAMASVSRPGTTVTPATSVSGAAVTQRSTPADLGRDGGAAAIKPDAGSPVPSRVVTMPARAEGNLQQQAPAVGRPSYSASDWGMPEDESAGAAVGSSLVQRQGLGG